MNPESLGIFFMKKVKHFILTKSIGLYINLLSYIHGEKARDLAYTLFSSPRKGRLKREKMPKTLYFSKRETIHYQNEKIQSYIWQGDEKVILLIHGWESNSARWRKLLYHLKPTGHTIIALDAPAHGLSDGTEFNTPKYAEFINILVQKYNPETLIGHSVGGMTIAYYLDKFQNTSVNKAVILGAPSDFKLIFDDYISLLNLNTNTKKLLKFYFFERFNIQPDEFSGHRMAQNFSQKAFIVHDTQDKVISVEEGRKYAEAWKNSIYVETTGLGHSLHDDDLYRKIVAFLTSK